MLHRYEQCSSRVDVPSRRSSLVSAQNRGPLLESIYDRTIVARHITRIRTLRQQQLPDNTTQRKEDDYKCAHFVCDVVIPYYTNLRWLPQAIDSILGQRAMHVVVHLVNDCSPEDDSEIREEYRKYPQLIWYTNPKNVGPYRSVHQVFFNLQTPYLANQDSDDIACGSRLWRAINALKTTECDFYAAHMEQFADKDLSPANLDVQRYLAANPILRSGILGHANPVGQMVNGTSVFRKQAFEDINGYAAHQRCSCDAEIATRCGYAKVKRVVEDVVVGLRRVHASSVSRGAILGYRSEYRRTVNQKMLQTFQRFKGCEDFSIYGTLREDMKTRARIVQQCS